MGQKISPISIRLRINKNFGPCWFHELNYSFFVLQDLIVRNYMGSILKSIDLSSYKLHTYYCQKQFVIYLFSNDTLKKKSYFANGRKLSLWKEHNNKLIAFCLGNQNKKQLPIRYFITQSYIMEKQNGGLKKHVYNSILMSRLNYKTDEIQTNSKSNIFITNYMKKKVGDNFHILKHIKFHFWRTLKNDISFIPIQIKNSFKSADFISQHIAHKIEKYMHFRQVFKNIVHNAKKNKNIQGIRISCGGRINGSEIARVEYRKYGQTSLHVFSKRIDYAYKKAHTIYGMLGIKVWVYFSSDENH